MERGKVAQNRTGDLPKKRRPDTAAAEGAEKGAFHGLDIRQVLLNVAFILTLVVELALVFKVYLSPLKEFLTAVAGLVVAGILYSVLSKLFLDNFKEELKQLQRGLLQNRVLTRVLAVLVLLFLYPAVISAWMILRPPHLLRIVPGKGAFSLLSGAVPGRSPDYELRVTYGGRPVNIPVLGPGSIYIGASREYMRGRRRETVNEQEGAMIDYLLTAGVEKEDDQKLFLRAWDKPQFFDSSTKLSVGETVTIILTCCGGEKIAAATETIDEKTEIKVVFLQGSEP